MRYECVCVNVWHVCIYLYAMHSCTHTSTEVQNKLYRLNARTKLVRQELIAEVLEPNTYRHTCTQV